MKLRFTKQARIAFLQIVDIFVEYAGQRPANLFIEKTNQCDNKLLKYPHTGHPEELLADRKRLYRTISINTNYRLIYHVTSTTIWIVDVWDRRRDPLKLTKRIK